MSNSERSESFSHLGGVIAWLFLAVLPVHAAFSFNVTSVEPSSISDKNQEVLVRLEITGLPSASYFRAAFQKDSGEPYFGYLKNNSDSWAKIKSLSSGCQDYYSVTDTSISSLDLVLKVGEDSQAEPGQYQIKAHRFTATCQSSSDSQNSLPISLNWVPPTSTPASTSTPSPSPRSTSLPASTPLLAPVSTSVPASVHPSPQILSLQTESPPPVTPQLSIPSPQPTTDNSTRTRWPAVLLIFTGAVLLAASGFLFIRPSGLMDKWPN